MERLKVLYVVMVFVMCVGTSLAVVATKPLQGGDWLDASIWQYNDIANDPGDDVYTEYTYESDPLVLGVGDSTNCRNMYLGLYDGLSGGHVQIDGTLTSSLHLIYGNWFNPSTPVTKGQFIVSSTGSASFAGQLKGTGLGSHNTQEIHVAGALSIAGAASGVGVDAIDIFLTGNGSMSIGGTIAAGTGLTFDFADNATLTAQTASFDALMLAGDITSSEGTVGMLVDNGNGTAVYGIVPEPATMALLGLGAVLLRRRK